MKFFKKTEITKKDPIIVQPPANINELERLILWQAQKITRLEETLLPAVKCLDGIVRTVDDRLSALVKIGRKENWTQGNKITLEAPVKRKYTKRIKAKRKYTKRSSHWNTKK